jgi:hypothetical protein
MATITGKFARNLTITGECMFEGCKLEATCIAIGRADRMASDGGGHSLGVYCGEHAYSVSLEGSPQIGAICRVFGVN